MGARSGMRFLAGALLAVAVAGQAEAPAAPPAVRAALPAPVVAPAEPRQALSRLVPAGSHWAAGLALAFR